VRDDAIFGGKTVEPGNDNEKLIQAETELNSLSEELLHSYQEINLLYRLSEIMGVKTDLEEIAQALLDEVLEQVPARRASVMLLDPGGEVLTVIASKGIPLEFGKHPTVRVDESLVSDVVHKGIPLLVNDMNDHPVYAARLRGEKGMTTSLLSVPLLVAPAKHRQETIGTINLTDNFHFSSNDLKLLTAVAGQAALAIKRIYLINDLKKAQKEIEDAFFYTVLSLARAAEASDEDTGNHIVRVGSYARIMAGALGMPESYCRDIFYFSQMHDAGKMHIHPEILRKKGGLTDQEWAIMKSHPEKGAEIIGDEPRLRIARDSAMGHHERWDGSGYPRGLKGEEIPLAARIVMLADVYDALRSARAYKSSLDHERAMAIITEGDGRVMPTHFDPAVLEAFRSRNEQFKETYEALKG
jgi:HD-GYP domain-containing protein (c-di-GMP phosphodiesterase class II)